MDKIALLNKTIEILKSATLAVPAIVATELVKESTKKIYNWVLDKLKPINKEADLTNFENDTNNLRLQGKLESSLETIIQDSTHFEALSALVSSHNNILVKLYQENQSGKNEVELKVKDSLNTDKVVDISQKSVEGDNNAKLEL
jgi:hypothetical protein